MVIINSLILYSEQTTINLLEFCKELAQGLLNFKKIPKRLCAPKHQKIAYSLPAAVRLTNIWVH